MITSNVRLFKLFCFLGYHNDRNIIQLIYANAIPSNIREGVGTSNFRTTTGHFFQNVKMVFLVDQNIKSQKDQNVESVF